MSKITRKKLARGAKLLVDHIFTPLTAAQTVLTTATVDASQREASLVPFRVNLSIPKISGAMNRVWGSDKTSPYHGIPFMLPPLQEDLQFTSDPRFGKSAEPSVTAPVVILDEVSFSFDQRLEPAAITGEYSAGVAPSFGVAGGLDYENTDALEIRLSILERRPAWFDVAPTSFAPDRLVWSGIVQPIALTDGFIRLNPFVSSDINEVIDPFKCYVFVIDAPQLFRQLLGPVTKDYALNSVEVSMRFLAQAVPRDSGAAVQNLPTRHLGVPNANLTHLAAGTTGAGENSSTPRPLMAASPVAGDEIRANDAGGVQTSMAVVDEMTRRKLQGGYKFDGDVPMLEELADTAGYSVIAVPLFNNTRWGGVVSNGWQDEPYASGGAGSSIIDRRHIPIEASMTVHHVLFTYNWQRFTHFNVAALSVQTQPTAPVVTPALKLEIGVGIGTGVRGDNYGYQQIANKTLVGHLSSLNWRGDAVDLIANGNPATLPYITSGPSLPDGKWNLELHAMDIIGSGSPGLNGMTIQGAPFFIGRSTSASSDRTVVDAGPSAPSAVAGQEQWIEVRARIGDNDPAVDIQNDYTAESMILGGGGIWVYIIGKTHLV